MELKHQLTPHLKHLRLSGILETLDARNRQAIEGKWSYVEFLSRLLEDEVERRAQKQLRLRLRRGALNATKTLETFDFQFNPAINRQQILALAACEYIRDKRNVLICGPTGVGKTWIACALAHKACREGFSAHYLRLPRLFEALHLAHGDGRYHKLMSGFAKTDLLILDDWGLAKLNVEQRRDLLELLDDRHGHRSTIVTSQIPVDHWHDIIADPTLADAILDRLVHNAYKINLKGGSMRKRKAKLTRTTQPE